MKNFLLFILLFPHTVCNNNAQPTTKEYISFEEVNNNETKYTRPLIISKQKLTIKLDATETLMFQDWLKMDRKAKLDQFIGTQYDLAVTDENTYTQLLSFITTHPEFYSNYTDKRNEAGYWQFTANGKDYPLFYKTKKECLRQLISHLKSNNCDPKVIFEFEHFYFW